jgi:Tfp pilus assembly protein PilN
MRLILFNLAPYRARKENARKAAFYMQMALVVGLTGFFSYSVSNELKERVEAKDAYLSEVALIEKNIETQANEVLALEKKLNVIRRQVGTLKSIEQDTLLSSQLLSVLDKSVPMGVALAKVVVNQNEVSVFGRTTSVDTLAEWTEYLRHFPQVYGNAELVRLTIADTTKYVHPTTMHDFEIKLTVVAPSLRIVAAEGAK